MNLGDTYKMTLGKFSCDYKVINWTVTGHWALAKNRADKSKADAIRFPPVISIIKQ